jgi:large subunit ribosomal protein L6
MSRVGKLPVAVPEKVKVDVQNSTVSVEGPKGKLNKTFSQHVKIELGDEGVQVSPANNGRIAKAMHGTARAIISNMVKGVTEGYSKNLEINGVGFRAALKGDILDLALGYSHPIHYKVPQGIKITVNENTKVLIEGIDKQAVGAVAADIRRYYPPEPYKGKGVTIVGEKVRRKEGKTVS